jgi:hypothetical protein
MAKYTVVLGPVEHDGKIYADGLRLELSDALAAPLLAVGAVALNGKAPAPPPAPVAPPPTDGEGDTQPPAA